MPAPNILSSMCRPAQFPSVERATLPEGPLHLAIGMFDGVHRGHRAVIDAAVAAARTQGGVAAVLTFWPHPSALFRPNDATRLIQDGAAKARVLASLGVEAVITEAFTPQFAAVPAEQFLAWLKQRLPTLAVVYVGENFRFGRGRGGDVGVLQAAAKAQGVVVVCAPRVIVEGEAISSTRIRTLLEQGDVARANQLLGYHYFSTGIVTAGKRLGRTIGFPTLNVGWSPGLRPRLGVYAVLISGEKDATPRPGVANYGLRPTVEQTTEPRLEVHVLGDCPFQEGDAVSVEWLEFLRPERKFGGVEELRAQIAADRTAAADYFARR